MATKIYKPEIVQESPLELDSKGYQGDMPENDNGFIKMSVEEDVVIQRISRDLYKYAASGFRELFVNEAKACRYAAKKYGTHPTIHVLLDPQKRKMVIEGVDSMGMTWEVFRDVYTVLGRSTNFNGEESGQFGFGRASYTCLSEIMTLEVYSRETGEKFTVMGKNGVGFQTGLPEPKMNKYGTRITLTLHKDINFRKLWSAVLDVPRLSQVHTFVELASRCNQEIYGPTAQTKEIPPMTQHDRLLEMCNDRQVYPRDEHMAELGDEDIDLSFVSLSDNGENWKKQMACYLVGVPIEYEYKGKYEVCPGIYLINVKNERKFMPTPDRERFSEKAVADITEKIDAMITEHLQKVYTTDTIEEYLKSDLRLFLSTIKGEPIRDTLADIIASTEVELRGSDGKKTTLHALPSHTKLLVTSKFDRSKMIAAQKHNSSISVFKPWDNEISIDGFVDLGVQTLDGYIEQHELAEVKERPEIRYLPVHRYGERKISHVSIREIGEDTIIAKSSFGALKDALDVACGYGVAKFRKNISCGTPEDEFFEKITTSEYNTSEGRITGKEIADASRPILLFHYQNVIDASLYQNEKSIVVFGDSKALFEMAAMSNKLKIKYIDVDTVNLFKGNKSVRDYGLTFFSCLDKGGALEHHDSYSHLQTICAEYHAIATIRNPKLLELFRHTCYNPGTEEDLIKEFTAIDGDLA